MIRPTKIFSMLLSASCATGLAWGQTDLRDPMMPPAQLPNIAETSTSVGAETGSRQPVLQVLLIGRDRQSAVIDGRVLKRGEQLDQWRLVTVSDKGVLLHDSEGSQMVSAYPGVKKITPSPSAGAGSKHTNP